MWKPPVEVSLATFQPSKKNLFEALETGHNLGTRNQQQITCKRAEFGETIEKLLQKNLCKEKNNFQNATNKLLFV